jgi:hypothetical protein
MRSAAAAALSARFPELPRFGFGSTILRLRVDPGAVKPLPDAMPRDVAAAPTHCPGHARRRSDVPFQPDLT